MEAATDRIGDAVEEKRMRLYVRVLLVCSLTAVVAVMAHKLSRSFAVPDRAAPLLYASAGLKTLIKTEPRPAPSNDNILKAMEIFNIQNKPGQPMPIFDASLEDRGLTVISEQGERCDVRIGPSAFQSWAILGSTLGHEIEVHCRQDMMLIKVMDMAGSLGTHMAERAAYRYEISQKDRFGLSDSEVDSIQKTMDYYFPEKW